MLVKSVIAKARFIFIFVIKELCITRGWHPVLNLVDIPSYQAFREILIELRGMISLEEDKTTAAGVSQSKSPKITRGHQICWEFIFNQIEP